MQTCLEKRSMEERHNEVVRNDYNINNIYSELHPNARSTGDVKGKGTGQPGGMKVILPNCNGTIGTIDFSNYDTALTSKPGNSTDNEARDKSIARSLYSQSQPYEARMIDTTANIREGQYSVRV